MEGLRVAIIGLGGMGDLHRQMINEGGRRERKIGTIPGMRVTGCFDVDPERQRYAASRDLHAYDSMQELLDDPAIDLVICATPNHFHREIVLKALAAGKHVLCEKPAALCVREWDEMTAAAERAGRLLTVDQNRRWDEDFISVRDLCNSGALGQVRCIESRVHGSRGIPGDWRKVQRYGGGMLLDWGVHLLDQALCMVLERVTSVAATLVYTPASECDSGIRVTLTFESGLIYYVEVGTENYIPLPRWYVLGSEGTAVIKDWNMNGEIVRVTDHSADDTQPVHAASGITKTMAPRAVDTVETLPLKRNGSDVSALYNNIADAIMNGGEIAVKQQEVRRVLRLMETIAEAARRNQVLPFETSADA